VKQNPDVGGLVARRAVGFLTSGYYSPIAGKHIISFVILRCLGAGWGPCLLVSESKFWSFQPLYYDPPLYVSIIHRDIYVLSEVIRNTSMCIAPSRTCSD
jgi:hypothetical protein